MPQVRVQRLIAADPGEVWRVAGDPAHLPRWWPRTVRVEALSGSGRRARWTQVLEAKSGAPVRADYRCTEATEGERAVWEQQIEGTPFERVLAASRIELRVDAAEGGTQVGLTASQRLRGLSRLGGLMMKGATRRTLTSALDGLAEAVEPVEAQLS